MLKLTSLHNVVRSWRILRIFFKWDSPSNCPVLSWNKLSAIRRCESWTARIILQFVKQNHRYSRSPCRTDRLVFEQRILFTFFVQNTTTIKLHRRLLSLKMYVICTIKYNKVIKFHRCPINPGYFPEGRGDSHIKVTRVIVGNFQWNRPNGKGARISFSGCINYNTKLQP